MDEQYFNKRVEFVNQVIEEFDYPIDLIAIAASLINEVVVRSEVEIDYILKMIKEGIEYANEEEDDD